MKGFSPTIDQYVGIKIADLKRMGLLVENASKVSDVNISINGKVVATFTCLVNLVNMPYIKLSYSYNAQPKDIIIPLRFKSSNLGIRGYYYFVCPVTGKSCRKLYIVDGNFVSRSAFNPLYPKQTITRTQRGGLYVTLSKLVELDKLVNQKYRRETYKGKLTPYGRKCAKLCQHSNYLFQGINDL